MLSLGLSLTSRAVLGLSFSPASLFALSEPGVWYDPSDLTTMFTDTAGTTQAAVGDAVALVLDKSKGLVLGPELVTNGDFSNGTTGWSAVNSTLTVSNGQGVVTRDVSVAYVSTPFTTVIGRTYLLIGDIVSFTGVNALIRKSDNDRDTLNTITAGTSSVGRQRLVFTATATTTYVVLQANTGVAVFDNISVKELPGFHATQSTTTARPILARIPEGGRRNLLTFTEQFNDAAWGKPNSTITPDAAVSPDGTVTADKINETATTAFFGVSRNPDAAFSTTYTFSFYAKAAERNFAHINFSALGLVGSFNLTTGAVEAVAGSPQLSAWAVGSGWFRCSITFTTPSTGTNLLFHVITTALSSSVSNYTGTAGSGIFVWGAQLELGSTATAYQRVGSTYDVTEAGKADLYHLVFDGTDDWLVTPTITPGTDKAQVFAGVRKLSDAAPGIIAEFSPAVSINNGSWYLMAPVSAGSATSGFVSKGTLASGSSNTGFSAPSSAVLAGIADIAGDLSWHRRNGVQVSQSTADQGTGNYLAYPLYIGRRNGTASPFNGHLYSLVVRFGANLDAGTISSTEGWVAGKTGVTL
jgi:hypothetical protein